MSKKKLHRILLSLGILILVITLLNFTFNLYLKYKLPTYIKNNSDYSLAYQSIAVDMVRGSIWIENLNIKPKNADNTDILGITGTVSEVSISRIGLLKIVTQGKLLAQNLDLLEPNLRIRLAKPKETKKGQNNSSIPFRNITIKNGTFEILKHTNQRFIDVRELKLEVSNLRLSEKGIENQLPILFDTYAIQGVDFYFQPDSVYAIKAKSITTENGKMSIKTFELQPLISFETFQKTFPNRPNLISLKSKELNFSDIVLKKNAFSLSKAVLQDPEITLQTSESKVKLKKKPFQYVVDLQDVQLNNATVNLLKPSGASYFSAEDLDLNVQNLYMDKESSTKTIPFNYKEFLIRANDVNFQNKNQVLKIGFAQIKPNSIEIKNLAMSRPSQRAKTTQVDGTLRRVLIQLDSWKLDNSQLSAVVNSLSVENADLKIFLKKQPKTKRPSHPSGIDYPIRIKSMAIKNSNLSISDNQNSHVFKNLQASIKNLQLIEQTNKRKMPISMGSYKITLGEYHSKLNSTYRVQTGPIIWTNQSLSVNNLHYKPLISREEFIQRTPIEKDLYDIAVKQVQFQGTLDLFTAKPSISGSNLLLSGVDASIFRSKIPPDDTTVKPMYSALLRRIKIPLHVNKMAISDSKLTYEEDTKKSDGPGKLVFGKFNLVLENLNSGTTTQTKIPVTVNTLFMDVSPMKVNWTLDTGSLVDAFTINGSVSELPAASINSFVEPYLKIQTTGYIKNLQFAFKGDRSVLNGDLQMKHQSLKVSILKETGEKNKVLSAVANLFVKSNSGVFPETVTVEQVSRDQTKSFFNFFWQGLQEGLKKTLLGANADKNAETAKKTIETTKKTVETIKSDIKSTKDELKDLKEARKSEERPKGLKRIFKNKKKE